MCWIHINEVYPWHCGQVHEGEFCTTNEKDVSCPYCQAKRKELEGLDLNKHPLALFFEYVAREYDESIKKYPLWETKDEQWQMDAVKGEFLEVEAVQLKTKTTGKIGRELEELPQAANVCGKRWLELIKRTKEIIYGK